MANRETGLSEATLRVRYGLTEEEIKEELVKSFVELFRLYGNDVGFEVTVTANAILKSRTGDSYSIFFGHDYAQDGARSANISRASYVSTFADLDDVESDFNQDDFERSFSGVFGNSAVGVDSLINVVFIIRTDLENYERDKKTEGKKFVTLF